MGDDWRREAEVDAERIEIRLMQAMGAEIKEIALEFWQGIEQTRRQVAGAKTLDEAQRRVLGEVVARGDVVCSVCGDVIPGRKHARPRNYCSRAQCKREQQRVNQAAWRARSGSEGRGSR